MSSSREQILSRLRGARPELGHIEAFEKHIAVVPLADSSSTGLFNCFVEQAESLDSVVYLPTSEDEAVQVILELIGEDRRILSWAFEHIPLPGFANALAKQGVQVAAGRDASVRVGITGADAALAATGSLVLLSGAGKPRLASLLPPVYVAVLHQDQILADLETWVTQLRQGGIDSFREIASAMIISGPSRTADIAMQLILGMHGPGEMHIVILRG